MQAIIEGVHKFRTQIFPEKQPLFAALASGQQPSALVISCADSRVDMQLVTQADPGQLFSFRNAGNIIPPYGVALGAASATIEYAMEALDIPDVIVCGHSDCGAMRALLDRQLDPRLATVAAWLRFADTPRQIVTREPERDATRRLERLIELNLLAQLAHLRTHPSVAVRLASGRARLHGWVYDIAHGSVRSYDEARARFVPLEHATDLQEGARS
jgi:carbonic anhydrase